MENNVRFNRADLLANYVNKIYLGIGDDFFSLTNNAIPKGINRNRDNTYGIL
jgi:hypothetical protein